MENLPKDGSKFEDQYYLNGKKTGKWLTYDKDGLLGQSITYQGENTYELNTYNKSGGLATSGIIKMKIITREHLSHIKKETQSITLLVIL